MRLRNRRNRRNAEISMLNLIDVIFMLLIFFMITTTFNNYGKFNLSVPKSDVVQKNKHIEENIEIIIDKDLKYYLKINGNTKNIDYKNIDEEISKIETRTLKNVTLTADKSIEYGDIVNVMSKLKNHNVENINLNIQKNN